MSYGEVILKMSSDESATVKVKIADERDELIGGYQWLCPKAVANTAILFVLQQPYLGKIHMQNVFTPLDVFFFDEEGNLLKSDHMVPEPPASQLQPHYYYPDKPFKYVLEMTAGTKSKSFRSSDHLKLLR